MSCYHPLVGLWKGELNDTGKRHYHIVGNSDPRIAQQIYPGSVLIPCGHCIGCRLDYSRAWADRMMLELETSKKAVFVTLTYNNENLPPAQFDDEGNLMYGTLYKRDVQLYMKRLRKEFENLRIRFYLAGEYGPSTLRPHYHAILFGIGLDDFVDLKYKGQNELGNNYYTSVLHDNIWKLGFSLLADVSWKTCAYVARYVTKKLNGPYAIDYAVRNVLPEFALMSRKPGLGREYLELHPDCFDYQDINLSTPEGGLKIRIPKYYLKQLELTDKERYDKMIADRKDFAEDAMILKLQKTGLSYLDYLEAAEEKKLSQLKGLRRSVVK